ncbi:glycosyltransferase [Niallia alba]|uniref:Glycosyltransferase family 4 protein n=1 Tax=Niallia alba TaxID=2729105 RepID=A0A7Y0PNY9_9BACI|nr:glycosyltransferase [Niallia alba]NMO79577.1 glycosyltransferase family 4 protein [Niallia alba]
MGKNITFVLGCVNKLGGTEKATIDLANLLSKKGYNVSLVSIYKKIATQGNSYQIEKNIEVKYVYTAIEFLRYHLSVYRLLDFMSKKKINKVIENTNPDIVFFTDIKHIPFRSKAFQKILMVHNCYEHYRSGRLTRNLLNNHYKDIDNVVFLSKNDLKKYNEEFKAQNGNYVYNVSQILPSVRTNFNNHKITYIGRLDNSVKQLDHSIEAIEELINSSLFSGWEYQIFGSGPDKDKIRKMIENKGLTNSISLKGTTAEIEKILSESDIVLLTSDFEGLPMSLIEGASCGVPLISYDSSSGIHDIIVDNFNGYIVEKNNIGLLSEKIKNLVLDENLRKQFGYNGVRHMQENFSQDRIFKEWVAIFKSH